MQTLGDGVPEADPPSYLRGLLEDEVARAEHLLEAAALHDAQQQPLLLEDAPPSGAAAAAAVPRRGAGSLAHAAAAAALSKSSQRVDSLFLAVRDNSDSDGKGGGASATAEARIRSASVHRLVGKMPFGVPIVGLSARTSSGAIDAATASIDNELSEVLSGAFDAAAAAPSGIGAVASLLDAPGDGSDEGGAADAFGEAAASASDAGEDNNYGDEAAEFGERHSGDGYAIGEEAAVRRRASSPGVDIDHDSSGAASSAGLAQVATLGAAGTALALTAAAIAAGVLPSQLASAAAEVDLTPLTEEAMQKETARILLSHNWGSGTAALRRMREMRYLKVCDTPSSARAAAR